MKNRTKIISLLSVYLCACFLLLCVYVVNSAIVSYELEGIKQNVYGGAVYGIIDDISEINSILIDMGNADESNMNILCAGLYKNSLDGLSSISRLPKKTDYTEHLSIFFSKLSEFSSKMMTSIPNVNINSDEEYIKLSKIASELNDIFENKSKNNVTYDSFLSYVKQADLSLILVSEYTEKDVVNEKLNSLVEINQDQALRIAKKALDVHTIFKITENESYPKMYTVYCENASVQLTKSKGDIVRIFYNREINNRRLNDLECIDAAKTFIKNIGYKYMTLDFWNSENNVVSARFYDTRFDKSQSSNYVLISIGADTGNLCFFDSSDYFKYYQNINIDY